MFNKFLGFIGLQKKEQSVFKGTDGFSGSLNSLFSFGFSKDTSAYMKLNSGWVYACVRAISQGISSIQFKLYKKNKKGTYEEIDNHELLDLLSRANSYQSGNELKYLTASHLELAGNAYWILEGVMEEGDIPTAIYPINPTNVNIIKGEYPDLIKEYKIKLDDKTLLLKPFQVLHIKNPDPNNPIEGMGTVEAALQWIDTDNYATEVNRNYFLNGARLSGILESDTNLGPEQMEVLRKSFEQVYKGVKNSYKVAVLPAGTKYNTASDNPKDMDFANLADKMRDRILSIFGVPKTILGSSESETNRATAETANYVFANRTLRPKMQTIVDYLNERLVPLFGDDLWLSFEDPSPEDRAAKMSELTAAMGGQPVLSVNEGRDIYFGKGPIENGDEVMTTFNLVPLGAPKAKEINIRTEKTFKGVNKKEIKTGKKEVRNIASEIANKLSGNIKSVFSEKKNITELSYEEYIPIHNEKIGRVASYEKLLKSKITDYNKILEKETLKRLPKLMKNKSLPANSFFDEEENLKVFIDLTEPLFLELYGKEAAKALSLIGVSQFDVLRPEVRKALERAISLLGENYNLTTIDLLKSSLEQGISEGLSMANMKDKMSAVFNYSDQVRAETVARTEVFRVANDAEREAWKQSGVVSSLKWFTAEDELVCEFCGPMNEKEVGIDENFFNKGDTVQGKEGGTLSVDYAPISGGALHPNCRCEIRPAGVTEEKMIKEVDISDEDLDKIIKEL